MNPKVKKILPWAVFAAALAIWEFCVRAFHISLYILPAPTKIIRAMIENAGVLWKHSLVTLSEALIGLAI